MFTELSKKKDKNYNPLGEKWLWVKVMQVIRVPRVARFNSFLLELPVKCKLLA
jgi:hypothetical protein